MVKRDKGAGWGGPRTGAGRPRGEPQKVVKLPVPIAEFARRLAARGGQAGGVAAFLDVDGSSTAAVPFALSTVPAGFPSPAEDYMDAPLDFNELVGARLPQTFAVVVSGESMTGRGIHAGDIAVVDRSRPPRSGDVVVAYVNMEPTIKTYIKRGGKIILHPENTAFPDIIITEETDFDLFGVVRNVVKKF